MKLVFGTSIVHPYQAYLNRQIANDLYRSLPNLKMHQSLGQDIHLDFSSNDYLGLAKHPEVIEAACLAAKKYGVGSTGSRLLSGNSEMIERFETQIASAKGCEAALIFSSGFQANSSVLAALLDESVLTHEPLAFTDKLIHASLHQGCQLAAVKQIRFLHNDLTHLRARLEAHQESQAIKWIVTESVFGMDGDRLDMAAITALADEFNAQLYIDEAHATGVLGHAGYGLCSGWMQQTNGNSRGIAMGTFSKALGGSGGYIACSRDLRDYLINRCAGFIYSTALSPMQIAATQKAWELLPSLEYLREGLFARAQWLRSEIQALGFDTGSSSTQIIPIIVKSDSAVLALKTYLFSRGIIVSAIRPPTVPPGTARLRLALNVLHDDLACEKLLSILAAYKQTSEGLALFKVLHDEV